MTVYYYYVTYALEAVVRSCSVKKAFLKILKNAEENACARVSFLKKRLWNRCFVVNFAKFLRTSFLTEHLRWLLLAFQSESTCYRLRTSCSKQAQYLKFKWTKTSWKYNRSNIVQRSFLCYIAGFFPANISTSVQRCFWVDMTSRRCTTSNQRWNNVVYVNVEIYNLEQRWNNIVFFNVELNNVTQRRNKVVIFNVDFHNVGKRRNDVANITIWKKI